MYGRVPSNNFQILPLVARPARDVVSASTTRTGHASTVAGPHGTSQASRAREQRWQQGVSFSHERDRRGIAVLHLSLGMSVEAIALVLHHSKAAKDDLVVLLGIANHEGDGGAWPTIATLAKYARKTARAVQNSITRLTEIGEVEVDYNAGGNADCREDHRPNRYTIHLACPPECDRTTNHRTDGVKPTTPRDALAPANGVKPTTERGEVHDTDGVKPTSPKPSLEPSRTVPTPRPSSRKARTSPEANALTREWWDRNVAEHGWRPGEGFRNAFVSMRQIVHHALTVESYTDDEVREALVRIGPRSFTKAQLSDQCFGIRREREKSAPQLWWQGQEGA